jgi:bis(5'-nucleosidyl)-tetraphosphatase
MRTAFQVSAGGVVYRRFHGRLEFAVALKSGRPVWHLPKGLVEGGESLETTATREVREETGLMGAIEDGLGVISYWYVSPKEETRYHKKVYFFLFRQTGGDPSDHDWEVAEVRWLPAEEAVRKLSYKSESEIAAKALSMLQEGKREKPE